MLNPEEENKLNRWIAKISELSNLDAQMYYWMTAREFKWLADKLKETNDELKRVTDSYEQLSEQSKEYRDQVNKVMDESWKAHWEYNKEEDEKDE